MTTTAVRETTIKAPATVLRRVECDERDAAILCAVLMGDARTYRGLKALVALDMAALHNRLVGKSVREGKYTHRKGGGLMARGLVCGGPGGTLRPGPRLAGIDHGWPLELVEVEV